MRNEILNNSLKPYHKYKSYCLKCKNDTEKINPVVSNTSNGITNLLSKCTKGERKNQDTLKIRKQKEY